MGEEAIIILFFVGIFVILIGLIVYSVLKSKKGRQNTIQSYINSGLIESGDIILKGALQMTKSQVAKEAAKTVAVAAVGALFGLGIVRTAQPKPVLMFLGKDKIILTIENNGKRSDPLIIGKQEISSVTIPKQTEKYIRAVIELNDDTKITTTLRSFTKGTPLTEAISQFNSYNSKPDAPATKTPPVAQDIFN